MTNEGDQPDALSDWRIKYTIAMKCFLDINKLWEWEIRSETCLKMSLTGM